MVAACFHQGGLGLTAGTSECHVLKSLHKRFNWLSFSLPCRQESWHDNLRIIFEKMDEENLLQITPIFDRTFWELQKPLKSNPF